MQGLANPNLKVRRAKEHLDSLEKELRIFLESQPYEIFRHDDLESQEHVIEISFTPPPIFPIGAIAGDFVHCLRASLDYLIYGLHRIHTGLGPEDPPLRRTSFPIIGEFNPAKTFATLKDETFGIPEAAFTIVESLQPYNKGTHYKAAHLWRLNQLSNIEKHRHIPLDSGACNIEFLHIPAQFRATRLPEIVNDRSVMRFPLAGKEHVNFDPVKSIDVRFGIEEEGLLVTFSDLTEIYDFVSQKVIPRFACFFPD